VIDNPILGVDGDRSDRAANKDWSSIKDRRPKEPIRPGLKGVRKRRLPLLLLVLGLLAFVVVYIFFVVRTPRSAQNQELLDLETKLKLLESKVATIEGMNERIGRLELQGEQVGVLAAKIEGLEGSISSRIDEKLKEMVNLQQKGTQARPARPDKKQPADLPSESKTAVYHQVRSGETLYSIAKRYGMTADELSRLNNLTRAELIYVGQRLEVRKK